MLSYLCIYNPDLDPTGDHLQNQIAFYFSPNDTDDADKQLRHIGLAQGVVEFSKGFADGKPVSVLETDQLRIIIKLIEPPNWWVVTGVTISSYNQQSGLSSTIGTPGTATPTGSESKTDVNIRDLSPPELLGAQILKAYKRWRLHYGSMTDYLETDSHEQLVGALKDWWIAWSNYWNIYLHGQGAVDLLDDYTIKSKGQLKCETVEAIRAIIDKDDGLVDMIVTRHDDSRVVNEGCVWMGKDALAAESVNDIVRWAMDCVNSRNDSSFLQPSGFVYHLNQSEPKNLKLKSMSTAIQSSLPSVDQSSEHTSSQTSPRPSESSASSALANLMKGAINVNMHTATNMATTMANATVDSVTNLMGLVHMKSLSSLIGRTKQAVDVEEPPSDDLSESRFLIGLKEDLEEEFEDELEQNTYIITKKTVFLRLNSESKFKAFNIVVYRQRPFIFTLVFESRTKSLDDKSYYLGLHRRLVSLVDPIFTDLSPLDTRLPPNLQFYYLVLDPSKSIFESSLPSIPPIPTSDIDKKAEVDKMFLDHNDLIHLHQHIISLLLVSTSASDHEKYLRTSRNWWIYWTRDQGRSVIFARKASKKNHSEPSSTGKDKTATLLGAIGKDAKVWLDEYHRQAK
jgi:hypothetical protein